MHHNSIFELMLPRPNTLSTRPSSSGTSPPSHPSKRFKEHSTMSSGERPSLMRPPSTSRAAQAASTSESFSRRRPAVPRHISSTENPLNLRLPDITVGRYHPINFSSQHSSVAGTPSAGLNSPQLPLSPRTHQRQLSEAERRLHEYYRDRALSVGQAPVNTSGRPTSPRLEPTGSPGPVTPLELEAATSYFGMGSGGLSPTKKTPDKSSCHSQMRRNMSSRTPPIGSY